MSGGTEANNAVFHCAVTQFYKWRMSTPTHQHLRPHVITTKVEHDAVLLPLTCRYAMEAGQPGPGCVWAGGVLLIERFILCEFI